MDTLAHVLYYPQKPMATTRSMNYLKYRELPAGINAIVGIMCYTGYNQEDSVLMNHSGVDRGMFRSVFYRTYSYEEKAATGGRKGQTNVEVPDRRITHGMRRGDYGKLDDDGLIGVGERIGDGDILIGITSPLEEQLDGPAARHTKQDQSLAARAA